MNELYSIILDKVMFGLILLSGINERKKANLIEKKT